MADPNLAGALRNRAVQDFRRRGMSKANLEMMLDSPEMREADLLGSLDLLEHIVKRLVFALPMLEWAVDLNFIEYSKVHDVPPYLYSLCSNRLRAESTAA